MRPGQSYRWSISMWSDACILCTFRIRNKRSWISAPLPANSLGTAYRLSSTLYTTHWGRHFTTPERRYAVKDCVTQHRTLQTKRSWMSTSTEVSLQNPNPQRTNQPNIKWMSHLRTIHLRSLQSQQEVTRIGWLWVVTWRCIEAASRRDSPKPRFGVGRVCTIGSRRWGIRGYNSHLPCSYHLPRFKVLQSRNWFSAHREMRYGDECTVRCNWSASCVWRFCGASGREKGLAKSMGIQDQAR